MKKCIMLVIVCFMTVCLLIGCNRASKISSNKDGKLLKVYAVGIMSGGTAWGQFERGFYDICKELGFEGHYLSPQSANTLTELVNLCETAITNGAEILLLVVGDDEAFNDVLDRARQQGITLVGIQAPHEKLDAYIGTDPNNLGKSIAEALVNSFSADEVINVVTMQTILTAGIQIMQRDAFEKRLKELRPDAKIISYEECNSSAAIAQDRLSALYLANPKINSLVSLDSYAGLGAAAFVEEKGLQGKFHVIGIDDAAEILRCIQNGSMDCTVAQMWYKMGSESVILGKTIRDGGQFEFGNDTGSSIIYSKDVETWAKEYNIDL